MQQTAEPIGNRQVLEKLLEHSIHEKVRIARLTRSLEYGQTNQGLTIEFFFHVVVSLRDFGNRFFKEVVRPKIKAVESPTIYRSFKNTNLECDWLEDVLQEMLMHSGYAIGMIETGTFYNKRKKKKLVQLEINFDGKKYIQDKRDRRHTLQKGDLVFFKTTNLETIAPNVLVTHFTPILAEQICIDCLYLIMCC